MTNIIERLRSFPENVLEGSSLCIEAADEIEKLRGEVARLQDRLRCESKAREGREALLKDNERLEAERDAAVADAERKKVFIAKAVHALRRHRQCGDTYELNGWPEVNAALAAYAAIDAARKGEA